jgi:tetratricopeptide (TPR) repeat protein
MYGLAVDGAELDRRRIRVELISVLLDAGDREGATAELAALGRELPDEAEAHLEAGRLSARAGQTRVALERFRQAAAFDPRNTEAQVGAGTAALALYDFRAAIQHFDTALRLGASGEGLTTNLTIARLVQVTDPLAPGLPMAERARRLEASREWLAGRIAACPAAGVQDDPDAPPDSDAARFRALRGQPQRALRDPDAIAGGAALIARLHEAVLRSCPDQAPISRAWTLIAQAHPGEAR